jgi:restriction endonuclease S subunit
MLSDFTFRVVFEKAPPVSREFLTELLCSAFVKRQIEAVSQGASTSMKKVINPTLLNLRFPLPP